MKGRRFKNIEAAPSLVIPDARSAIRNPGGGAHAPPSREATPVITPLKLKTPAGTLSLFGVTTLFGMPQDVTLDELVVESFFPADAESAGMLAVAATGH